MIARAERPWVIWFALIVMTLTTFPYLIGYTVQGSEWQYSGLLLGIEDGFSYLAKMMIGAHGDWLFRTPYTLYPQQGFFVYFPYIFLGKLVGEGGAYTQFVIFFHLFRFCGGVFSVWATYAFCSVFIETVNYRRFAAILAVFGGGLGFLAPFGLSVWWQGVMKMPLEFYSPETFGFLSYLILPHLLWARGLLLMGLVIFLDPSHNKDWQAGFKIGLLWLLVGMMQPLTIVSGWAVLGMTLLLQTVWLVGVKRQQLVILRPWIIRAGCAGLLSAPIVLYNFVSFQIDPFLFNWQGQNLIPSPPPGDYLLAWGVALPLIFYGIRYWRSSLTMPIAWLLALPFLAYFPHTVQRRLVEGGWVAGSILVVVGLSAMPVRVRRAVIPWVGLAFLSTAVLFVSVVMGVSRPAQPLFQPIAEVKAMDFLAKVSQKNDIVLAAYATSNILPARAPVRVPFGHTVESISNDAIQARIVNFYSSASDDIARQSLLDEWNVRFVFWGPMERVYGDYDLTRLACLKVVYSADGYKVLEVVRK